MRRSGKTETVLTNSSVWHGLLHIWIRPGNTFQCLRTNWAWTPPYLTLGLMILASQLILSTRLQEEIEAALLLQNADPIVYSIASWIIRVSTVIGPFVQPLARAFMIALIASFVSALMGIAHRFGKVYSLAMWSLLPSMGLGTLFKSTLLAAIPDLPLASFRSDLLFFLPLTPGSVGYQLVAGLDLFLLWTLVLLSVGFITIHKCTKQQGLSLGISTLTIVVGVGFLWS